MMLLAEEIGFSIPEIIKMIHIYNMTEHRAEMEVWEKSGLDSNKGISFLDLKELVKKDKEAIKKLQQNDEQYHAFKIMHLLSDKSFCELVAKRSHLFISSFLMNADYADYRSCETKMIFDNIIESSFRNEDSLLNRENLYEGLAGVKILSTLIFKNERLFQAGVMQPFFFAQLFEFRKPWQVKLYLECLKSSTELSLNIDCHQTLSNIHFGYTLIKDISLGFGISPKLSFDNKIDLFNALVHGIGNILSWINAHHLPPKYAENEKIKFKSFSAHSFQEPIFTSSGNDSRDQEVSTDNYIAAAIFFILDGLSRIQAKNMNEEFLIRSIVLDLAMFHVKEKSKIFAELSKYIKHQIEENFKTRTYPVLTRCLIPCVGLSPQHKMGFLLKNISTFVLDKFKKDFHNLYEEDQEFALDMLPFSCSYDASRREISMKPYNSRSSKIEILVCN